ncbi:MAG: LuxR C-terminal-related transcriptional regulator [Rhodobacter sp.]|nr:LuxR C-terminal-related transcriptional regulator [Rhodobacter sp.]
MAASARSILQPEELGALIGLIYDSALEEPQWQRFVDFLHELYPKAIIALVGYDGPVGTHHVVHAGIEPKFLALYFSDFLVGNDTFTAYMNEPVGAIVNDHDYFTKEELQKHRFYTDWVVPQGLGAATFAIIASYQGRFVALQTAFPEEQEDEIRETLHPLFKIIVPHVIRAMEIARTIKLTRKLSETLGGFLDRILLPMLVTDAKGYFLFGNAAARRLLKRGAVFRIDDSGLLCLSSGFDTRGLRTKISKMNGGADIGGMQLETGDGTITLCIAPFKAEMADGVDLEEALFGSEDRFAIFVGQRAGDAISTGLLSDIFSLTKREAEIGKQLLLGKSPPEIAAESARSERTVRNQVQSIYSKLNVKSYAELVDKLSVFGTVGTLFESGHFATNAQRPN